MFFRISEVFFRVKNKPEPPVSTGGQILIIKELTDPVFYKGIFKAVIVKTYLSAMSFGFN